MMENYLGFIQLTPIIVIGLILLFIYIFTKDSKNIDLTAYSMADGRMYWEINTYFFQRKRNKLINDIYVQGYIFEDNSGFAYEITQKQFIISKWKTDYTYRFFTIAVNERVHFNDNSVHDSVIAVGDINGQVQNNSPNAMQYNSVVLADREQINELLNYICEYISQIEGLDDDSFNRINDNIDVIQKELEKEIINYNKTNACFVKIKEVIEKVGIGVISSGLLALIKQYLGF